MHDPRYAGLDPKDIPDTECLKDTVARVLPYWHEVLAPAIKAGQRVLVAAHGNSLRALVKYLDGISDEAIVELNIPNGVPLVYEFDDDAEADRVTTTWATPMRSPRRWPRWPTRARRNSRCRRCFHRARPRRR